MKYGYTARLSGSVEVDVSYEDMESAIEAGQILYEQGWEVSLLEYSEEYSEEVEKEASKGFVFEGCRQTAFNQIFESDYEG